MNRLSIQLLVVVAIAGFLVGASELQATPPTIDTFPYTPNEGAQASHFEANYGSGPTPGGSTWTNGTLSGPRRGTGGAGVQAWAVLPTQRYAVDTVTWLHSPVFDFSNA